MSLSCTIGNQWTYGNGCSVGGVCKILGGTVNMFWTGIMLSIYKGSGVNSKSVYSIVYLHH